MRSDSICFNEMDRSKLIAFFDIQILSSDVQSQRAHTICLRNRLLSYLKKKLICQWSKRMYLCGFVPLSVWMSVAGANKVEGTMS